LKLIKQLLGDVLGLRRPGSQTIQTCPYVPKPLPAVPQPELTIIAKFLCVKGILFFSFWQSIAISFLVAVHAIRKGQLALVLVDPRAS
jgi:hypothetical protein